MDDFNLNDITADDQREISILQHESEDSFTMKLDETILWIRERCRLHAGEKEVDGLDCTGEHGDYVNVSKFLIVKVNYTDISVKFLIYKPSIYLVGYFENTMWHFCLTFQDTTQHSLKNFDGVFRRDFTVTYGSSFPPMGKDQFQGAVRKLYHQAKNGLKLSIDTIVMMICEPVRLRKHKNTLEDALRDNLIYRADANVIRTFRNYGNLCSCFILAKKHHVAWDELEIKYGVLKELEIKSSEQCREFLDLLIPVSNKVKSFIMNREKPIVQGGGSVGGNDEEGGGGGGETSEEFGRGGCGSEGGGSWEGDYEEGGGGDGEASKESGRGGSGSEDGSWEHDDEDGGIGGGEADGEFGTVPSSTGAKVFLSDSKHSSGNSVAAESNVTNACARDGSSIQKYRSSSMQLIQGSATEISPALHRSSGGGMTKVGIIGFCQIGGLVLLVATSRGDLIVLAVIAPFVDTRYMACLSKYDSTQGLYKAIINVADDSTLEINGNHKVTRKRNPEDIPMGDIDAEYIVELSGVFTTLETAAACKKGGARKVGISAPSIDASMFAIGVNEKVYKPNLDVVSDASCITNCQAPSAKRFPEQVVLPPIARTTAAASTGGQAPDSSIVELWYKPIPKCWRYIDKLVTSLCESRTGKQNSPSRIHHSTGEAKFTIQRGFFKNTCPVQFSDLMPNA